MNIKEMHTWFDLVIDKEGSPYYTSNEKDLFLQRSQIDYVNNFFGNPTSKHVADRTDKDSSRLGDLVESVVVRSDVNGKVSDDSINTDLITDYMYILNVASSYNGGCSDDYAKCRFVRHNDYYNIKDNEFKKPTEEYPIHRVFDSYLQIDPKGERNVQVTVCREPVKLTLDDPDSTGEQGLGAVDSSLSDKVHNQIVYGALRYAGINIRETEFYQMVSANGQTSV